jgi:hypothetical protein
MSVWTRDRVQLRFLEAFCATYGWCACLCRPVRGLCGARLQSVLVQGCFAFCYFYCHKTTLVCILVEKRSRDCAHVHAMSTRVSRTMLRCNALPVVVGFWSGVKLLSNKVCP